MEPAAEVQSVILSHQPEAAEPRRAVPAFAGNRLFSTAIRNAAAEPAAGSSRRREAAGRPSDIPEDGFRTRSKRSVSPPREMRSRSRGREREVVIRRDRADEPRRFHDDEPRRFHDAPHRFSEEPRRFNEEPRRSHEESRRSTEESRRFNGEPRRFNDDARRVVSKEDGTIKIQVSDARSLITRRGSVERSASGRVYSAPPMAIDGPEQLAQPSDHVRRELPPKCSFWPNCDKGRACAFFHPSKPCSRFPACAKGADCTYIHPQIACKYQEACQNPACNFVHYAPANPGPALGLGPSTMICKFYPNCTNRNCAFVHPIDVPCKYQGACQRPGCHFKHPEGFVPSAKSKVFAPCLFGKNCARPGCAYQHQPADDMDISPTTVQETPMGTEQPIPTIDTAVDTAQQ